MYFLKVKNTPSTPTPLQKNKLNILNCLWYCYVPEPARPNRLRTPPEHARNDRRGIGDRSWISRHVRGWKEGQDEGTSSFGEHIIFYQL